MRTGSDESRWRSSRRKVAMQSPMVQAEYGDALPATSASERRLRRNGMIIIFSMTIALALVTASECQSITHLPSLIYGFVLWGWWGCIAAFLWRLGERIPVVSSFSCRGIATHLLAGPALGVAHWLLLGSLGFIVPGWRGTGSAVSVVDQPAQHQSPGDRVADLRVYFWGYGGFPVSDSCAAAGDAIA